MRRNENESGVASCSTIIRRLILPSLLTCPAWTVRCMRPTFEDLTCTQVDRIDLIRHVRTNTWQQKRFHPFVIMLLPSTHRTNPLFTRKTAKAVGQPMRIFIQPSKNLRTKVETTRKTTYLNRPIRFYLPLLPLNLFFSGPPLHCAFRVELIYSIVVKGAGLARKRNRKRKMKESLTNWGGGEGGQRARRLVMTFFLQD